MVRTAYYTVLALLLGVYLFIASYWLTWDWINSIVNGEWLDWQKFCERWVFYAPLFLYEWRCNQWTGPYDTHLLLAGLGVILITASAFILGYSYGLKTAKRKT